MKINQKMEEKTISTPKLIVDNTGGDPPAENWLTNLERGSMFLFRNKKHNGPELQLAVVLEQMTKSTALILKLPDGKQIDLWVDHLKFSRDNDLVESIRDGMPVLGSPQGEEENDERYLGDAGGHEPSADGESQPEVL